MLNDIQTGLYYTAKPIQLGNEIRYSNPTISLKRKPLLKFIQPEFVRVRMSHVGICGTDIDLLKINSKTGFIKSSVPISLLDDERLIGHEGIGQVIGVGATSSSLKIGDWVVPAGVHACGKCRLCLGDFPNQCLDAKVLGTQIDGIFADIVDIPISLCHVVTNFINSEDDLIACAALEPAATALQACEVARVTQVDKVLIFGAGPIGAYCAMISKLIYGCNHVTVIEPELVRRSIITKYADTVYESHANIDLSDNFDVIIEASGYLDNVTAKFRSLNAGGRVILLARSGNAFHFDAVDHMITNKISITGCRGQLGGYMNQVADYYFQGKLPLRYLVKIVGQGLHKLEEYLNNPQLIVSESCKSLIRL